MARRRKHDWYPTLPDLCREIVRRVSIYAVDPAHVIEPTAGDGPFVRAARTAWPEAKITAIDLLDARDDGGLNSADCLAAGANKFLHADFLSLDLSLAPARTLHLGNPPFTIAAKILAKICATAREPRVAFLLPVSFWGRTQERDGEFWRLVGPAYFAPIHPRPSFTGNGKTDRMEYGLFMFGDGWGFLPKLGEPVVFEKEAA